VIDCQDERLFIGFDGTDAHDGIPCERPTHSARSQDITDTMATDHAARRVRQARRLSSLARLRPPGPKAVQDDDRIGPAHQKRSEAGQC
jgi:hypothetical protein